MGGRLSGFERERARESEREGGRKSNTAVHTARLGVVPGRMHVHADASACDGGGRSTGVPRSYETAPPLGPPAQAVFLACRGSLVKVNTLNLGTNPYRGTSLIRNCPLP
jgi:hypothetical protein